MVMIEKQFTIDVTQEDIDKGVAGKCASCPIALACKKHEELKGAFVYETSVHNGPFGECMFRLPFSAREFVTRFDDGLKIKPFSFTVTAKLWKEDKKKGD